jgi:hypothetical protein
MRKKKFVFGMGSGCCGTASLALLLNSQPNALVSHELAPILTWDNREGKDLMQFRYGQLDHQSHLYDLVGDVGLYYVSYIGFLMKSLTEVEVLRNGYDFKFIVLKRDRESVINSFYAKFKRQNNNPLQNHNDPNLKTDEWDRAFPKYDDMILEDAIGQYYDDYYKKARSYELLYPDNVKLFNTSDLNDENGVRSILEFVGVEIPNIVVGIKKNVTAEIEENNNE